MRTALILISLAAKLRLASAELGLLPATCCQLAAGRWALAGRNLADEDT